MVPYGQKLLAILTGKRGDIFIHIDQQEAGMDFVESMSGIALASVGGPPASAWPVFAKRCEPDFEPKVIARGAAAEGWDTFEGGELRKTLARGVVHWDPYQLTP